MRETNRRSKYHKVTSRYRNLNMEESLILAVSHHPVLYNTTLKDYKNHKKREAALFEVARERERMVRLNSDACNFVFVFFNCMRFLCACVYLINYTCDRHRASTLESMCVL